MAKKCFGCKRQTKSPRFCGHCRNKYSHVDGRDMTRLFVRIRDNFRCQDCNKKVLPNIPGITKKQRQLDIHHLNGLCGKKSKKYDRVSEMAGLITLCHRCHFNRPEHATKRNAAIKRRAYV